SGSRKDGWPERASTCLRDKGDGLNRLSGKVENGRESAVASLANASKDAPCSPATSLVGRRSAMASGRLRRAGGVMALLIAEPEAAAAFEDDISQETQQSQNKGCDKHAADIDHPPEMEDIRFAYRQSG